MISLICKLLDISKPTFFRYKKKRVPIILFLEKYLEEKDIQEFLNNGSCEKFENLNFIIEMINYKIKTNFFKSLKTEEIELLKDFVRSVWNKQNLSAILKPIDGYEYNTSLFINTFKDFAKDKTASKNILQKFQLLDIPEKYYLLKFYLQQIIIDENKKNDSKKNLSITIIEDDPQQATFLKNSLEIEFDSIEIHIFDNIEKIEKYTYSNENLIFIDYHLNFNFWFESSKTNFNTLKIIEDIRKVSDVKIVITSADKSIQKISDKIKNSEFVEKSTSNFLNRIIEIVNEELIK